LKNYYQKLFNLFIIVILI